MGESSANCDIDFCSLSSSLLNIKGNSFCCVLSNGKLGNGKGLHIFQPAVFVEFGNDGHVFNFGI